MLLFLFLTISFAFCNIASRRRPNTFSIQYHSTPEFRDQGKVEGAPPTLEYDGSSEYWARDMQTFENMLADKDYQTKIAPDEANFLDPQSVKMTIGVEYIVVENQNAVTEHGRAF